MTSKQAEIMRLYRQGLSTCEIARRLGVTKANVRYFTRRSQRQEAQVDIPVPGTLHSLPLQRQLLYLSAPGLCNS
ncbi:MAG: LuxR C-terminal-related transcriptional regulator [Oscillospiraceae bacterium]